jgi:hypothetical protein
MKYREPGFLTVALFGSSPPPSRQQVVSLSRSFCVSPVELTKGGWGAGGAKPYDGGESLVIYNPLTTVLSGQNLS